MVSRIIEFLCTLCHHVIPCLCWFVHTISSSLSASITHCLYSVTLNHCSVHDLLLSVLTVSTLVGMFSVACESSASCSPLHLEK